jgi:hypothetical protein
MSSQHGTRQRRHISGARGIRPLLITFVFAVLANEAAAQIRPVDLGTLGHDASSATAVNASGQVVGSSGTANGEEHAFLPQRVGRREVFEARQDRRQRSGAGWRAPVLRLRCESAGGGLLF